MRRMAIVLVSLLGTLLTAPSPAVAAPPRVAVATTTAGQHLGAWLDVALRRVSAPTAPCHTGDVTVRGAGVDVGVTCGTAALGTLHLSPTDPKRAGTPVGPVTLVPSWDVARPQLPWSAFLAALQPPPLAEEIWQWVEPAPSAPGVTPTTPLPPPPSHRTPPTEDPGQLPWAWLLLAASVLATALLWRRPLPRRIALSTTLALVSLLLADALVGFVLTRVTHARDLADWRTARSNFNDVFLSTGATPVDPSRGPPFVIGVFGGSVALQIGESLAVHPEEFPALAELDRQLGRPIVVKPLAVPGSSEPSQFNVLHLFHDQIDAAMFLDGFNELFTSRDSPDATCDKLAALWARNRVKPVELLAPMRRLAADIDDDLQLTRLPPLRWSVIASWLFDARQLRAKQEVNRFYRWPFESVTAAPEVDLPPASRVVKWQTCIERTTQAAAAMHLPVVFFLQPNQYVRGSKPLSVDERTLFTQRKDGDGTADSDAVYRQLTERYADLQAAVAAMQAHALPVQSLVPLFAQTTQTVYADDCCHFNRDGIAVLGNAMVRQLATRLR